MTEYLNRKVDGNIHHSDAWYWTVDGNAVNLEAHRCSFRRGGAEGWTLIAARDIAEDGTICGHGTAPGEEPWSAWVLRLDTCVGNVDGADCVDFEDLIYLLNHWGPECSPADLDCDLDVDFHDLLGLLGDWGCGDCAPGPRRTAYAVHRPQYGGTEYRQQPERRPSFNGRHGVGR